MFAPLCSVDFTTTFLGPLPPPASTSNSDATPFPPKPSISQQPDRTPLAPEIPTRSPSSHHRPVPEEPPAARLPGHGGGWAGRVLPVPGPVPDGARAAERDPRGLQVGVLPGLLRVGGEAEAVVGEEFVEDLLFLAELGEVLGGEAG